MIYGGIFFTLEDTPAHKCGWWYEYQYVVKRGWNSEWKIKSFGPFKARSEAEARKEEILEAAFQKEANANDFEKLARKIEKEREQQDAKMEWELFKVRAEKEKLNKIDAALAFAANHNGGTPCEQGR